MAGSGVDAQSINAPVHRQQYVDFRVVVYRLNIGGGVNLQVGAESLPVSYNTIFNSDIGDEAYGMVSYALNSKNSASNFNSFLNSYYIALKSSLTQDGNFLTASQLLALGPKGPYQEIDITPLVRTVNNHIGLYDMNHCSMSIMDASISAFTDTELKRFALVNRFSAPQLQQLTSFKLREFDLVRVFAYSGIDVPPQNQLANLNQYFTGGLNSQFLLSPVFTGVVNKIRRGNEAGGSAFINVDMLGLERMFAQSTTVANGAVADQIITSLPTIPTLANTFSALEPRFANQRADEIVVGIFNTYLAPSFLQDSSGSFVLGVPDLLYLLNNKLFNSDQSINLLPMLPTIILIHIMKKEYGEPIIRFDDRIEPTTIEIKGGSGKPINAVPSPSKDLMLFPYLLRFRQAFSLYSGQYQSAMEIMDTIKSNTYMEIYEDRTGEFHFRFPRYNCINLMAYIDPKDVITATHDKDDSAIFTAETVQQVLPGYGSLVNVPPRVYIDKLSVLKFGLRKPQTVENPNAISTQFADELAQFARDYFTMRDARKATVVKLGDPTLNVGQMALFKVKKDAGSNSSPAADRPVVSTSTDEDVLAGYITTIDEVFAVGGQYTQSLGLSFVRAAAQTTGAFAISGAGTTWDIVNNSPSLSITTKAVTGAPLPPVVSYGAVTQNVVGPQIPAAGISSSTISALQKTPTDTSPFIFKLNYTNKSQTGASFRAILTPIDLAIVANKASEIVAAGNSAGLAAGTASQLSPADLTSALAAQATIITNIEADLATRVVMNAIWNKFLNDPASSPSALPGSNLSASAQGGLAPVSYVNLFAFEKKLEQAYNVSLAFYIQNLYATYSGTSMTTSGQSASLGAVQLQPNGITLSTSWTQLMKLADSLYKAYSLQVGDISFSVLWQKYFLNQSTTPLTSNDFSNAQALLGTLRLLIGYAVSLNAATLGLSSVGGTTGSNQQLSDAIAEQKALVTAQTNLKTTPVSTSVQNPATVPNPSPAPAPTTSAPMSTQYLILS